MQGGRTYLSSAVCFTVVGAYEGLDSSISCPVLYSVLGEFVATCLQDKVATPALDKRMVSPLFVRLVVHVRANNGRRPPWRRPLPKLSGNGFRRRDGRWHSSIENWHWNCPGGSGGGGGGMGTGRCRRRPLPKLSGNGFRRRDGRWHSSIEYWHWNCPGGGQQGRWRRRQHGHELALHAQRQQPPQR